MGFLQADPYRLKFRVAVYNNCSFSSSVVSLYYIYNYLIGQFVDISNRDFVQVKCLNRIAPE